MAFSYPLPLTVLADRLPIQSAVFLDHRNDELSGSGDARVWQAEMADPLWTAEVAIDKVYHNEASQIAATIRKLYGAQEAFWLYDPVKQYPDADPTGSILGAALVKVNSIGGDNKSMRFSGLPAGYTLTLGDKFQINYVGGRSYFGEVSETIAAAVGGITPAFEVFPHLPSGLAVNDTVTLIRPACKMFVMPKSFRQGTQDGMFHQGMGFTAMQRKRST